MNRIYVLDTNVLISAVLSPSSSSSTALRKALREGIVVYSDKTLEELAEKIRLTKFDIYTPLTRRLVNNKTKLLKLVNNFRYSFILRYKLYFYSK